MHQAISSSSVRLQSGQAQRHPAMCRGHSPQVRPCAGWRSRTRERPPDFSRRAATLTPWPVGRASGFGWGVAHVSVLSTQHRRIGPVVCNSPAIGRARTAEPPRCRCLWAQLHSLLFLGKDRATKSILLRHAKVVIQNVHACQPLQAGPLWPTARVQNPSPFRAPSVPT